jgi:sedoheptulokinase
MHFIGIDIGTSSICGVAYHLTDKKIESITKSNQTFIETSETWEKIQDPAKIMETVFAIITELTTKYPDIKGIGLTGQMHGVLYVNDRGDAVSPLYTWQDGRGNQPCKDGKTVAEYLTATTGHTLATGFGLVTHFYNIAHRLVPAAATKLCTIMDYAVMKLTGRTTPLMDYANAASLGFFDRKNLIFDLPAIESVGIDPVFLPEINQTATLAGYFAETIPVYSATGDNQASFLGSVRDIKRSVHVTVGTSSQISVYSNHYAAVDSVDTRPFPGGGYILVGAALCGGKSFEILKTFFEKTVKFFINEPVNNIDFYQIMSATDMNNMDDDLPVTETLFDGTRSAPSKRGGITHISISNLTPENLIISFLKGICRELYDFYQNMPKNIRNNKTILVGSGNGIKKNALLCKAFEEQFGCSLHLSQVQEESAFGACICAIVGGKYIGSFLDFID